MQTYSRELANFSVQTDKNKKGQSWIKKDRVYIMELVYRQMSSLKLPTTKKATTDKEKRERRKLSNPFRALPKQKTKVKWFN